MTRIRRLLYGVIAWISLGIIWTVLHGGQVFTWRIFAGIVCREP